MASSPKPERAPRKRGPNYTEAEKENLRVLAKRYKNVIESKCTGTTIFKQKADAWMQVAKSYNASSTSGIRTPEQLKHLYENMKQHARKALATSNKADYLRKLEEEEAKTAEVVESVYKSNKDEIIMDFKTLKFLDQSDKIERKKTGGGCFTPTIQEKDLKILELIKDQVEPLSNQFDSAASYFNDNLTQGPPIEEIATKATAELTTEQFSEGENMAVVEIIDESFNDQTILSNKEKPKVMKKNINCRTQKKKTKETQGRTRMLSASLKKKNYKNAYFKKKYENSILERRRLYQEIRLRQKEHLLLTKKLKLEIAILEKQ